MLLKEKDLQINSMENQINELSNDLQNKTYTINEDEKLKEIESIKNK